ncbi:MAG: class III extradiol dioxygenase family protein [Betaproteobacteria bacterium]
MARLVAGIGTSHVPSIGRAYDQRKHGDPAWQPLFDGYAPVSDWLRELAPDIAIVVYNDHGCDFFLDKYPSIAIGAADTYPIGDEGFGSRKLPAVKGDASFSWHLCESLVYDEFDITVCQEMQVEHGFLVPMNLCLPHGQEWPVAAVPIMMNVIQHPLPTARRCFKLGQAIRRAVDSYAKDQKVAILGTGGMSHQLHGTRFGYMNEDFDRLWLDKIESDPEALARMTHHEIMERAGAEAVELIMWLVMRGALAPKVRRRHRSYYAPMTTGMGVIALEDAV